MDRRIVLAQVMLPFNANLAGNVHGGEIMKMMDNTAAALARKYSKGSCVTARVDELEFLLPVFMGSLVTCTAILVYVGKTSMEILVNVDAENISGTEGPKRALSAFFTMVAMGENGKPREIKPYVPQTEEEIRLFEAAKARRLQRKAQKTRQ
jgi:acyl-CoA hydrolase